MSQPSWEADKMLDVYIHDYFIKRNLPASAKAFQAEGKVSTEPVAIDAPGGFLLEWWSVFWDIFISRTSEKHSEVAASYIETQQLKAREQQNQQLYMQIFRAQQQQQQPRREMAVNGTPNGLGAEVLMRQQSTANALAAKIYEERLKHPQQREAMEEASMKRFNESSNQMLDQAALLKAATSPGQASGQLLQAGNMPTALQQVQARNQQISSVTQDNKSDASTVLNQRSPAADPTMYGMSGVGHSKTTLLSPGASQGANNMQLKGWSLTGLDQMRSSQLLSQSQRSFMQSSPQYHHQLQMLNPQQQQQQQLLLQAQAQAQGNMSSPGASSLLNEIDVKRGRVLNRNALAVKDGQMNGVGDVSQGFGSPMSGPFSRSQEEMIMKMKLAQMHHHQQQQGNNQMQLAQGQQSQSSQQQPSQQQQEDQQLNMGGGGGVTVDGSISNNFRGNDQSTSKGQHVRKRKQLAASSGPANSTGTGNTTGPSPNSAPSTPSTHTPGDVMSAMGGTLQHGGVSSKPSLMFGSDGAGGLASPSNQLMQAEIDRFVGEDGSLEDNVESFLSINDAEGRESLFSTSKRSPAGHNTDVSKAFTFAEFGCLRASNSKVVSCHFSSDGKLLASAGHDKKAVLWNMDTLKLKSTLEEHSYLITDVRFSPNSTRLATSSFDRTVRVWDADNPSYSLRNFTGHSASILSLDFHPNNEDHLCSCDNDNEIRYWSVNRGVCTRAFKGGMTQVRFQPRLGRFLAAASDNTVSIFDVESSTCIHNLQRHTKTVHSVCWDAKGDLVASVSEDSVRVWALGSGNDGQCVHELSCNGNKFHSCVFHPTYPQLLVIGCYQSLELWNMAENKSMTMPAHDCLIAALAQSPVTGMVASASYDKCVKLWK